MERIRVATLVRMRLLRALSERGSQIFGCHLSGSSPDAEYLERVVGVWTHRPRTRSEGFSGHRGECLRPDVEGRSSSVRRQLPRGIVVAGETGSFLRKTLAAGHRGIRFLGLEAKPPLLGYE
jgi:hypothetical protein